VEYDPNKIYLPKAYIYGAATLGSLGATDWKLGAGVTAGAGLAFGNDQIATVGIEASVVKDVVNSDPALSRLMVVAQIRLW